MFFWPKDFTFICPTEIVAFGKLAGDFADRDTVVYGVSIDNEFVHLNWRLHHDDLRELPIPMLVGPQARTRRRAAASSTSRTAWRCARPSSSIRRASSASPPCNHDSVGRNPQEVLRVVDALQSDELCPCNWQQGDEFLRPAA